MSELLENFLEKLEHTFYENKNKNNVYIEINKTNFSLNEVDITIEEFDSNDKKTLICIYSFNKSKLDKKYQMTYLYYMKPEIEFVETDDKKALKLLNSYQDKLIDTLELFELI